MSGIISGWVIFNVEEVYENDTQIPDIPSFLNEAGAVCAAPISHQLGCPTEIPVIADKKIVAAHIYHGGHPHIHALSCTGACHTYYAETRQTFPNNSFLQYNSMIINPGCTVHLFSGENYDGFSQSIAGPKTITQFKEGEGSLTCVFFEIVFSYPCLPKSMILICTQVFPSCTATDGWQAVTTIDNTWSNVSSQFSYTKTVGTTFSDSVTNSIGVSATVSKAISASFFDIFSSTIGLSLTTDYDWTSTDTETRSETKTFKVDVDIPPGVRVSVEEAVGTCGGSSVHTLMYRIRDDKTNKIVRKMMGKMTKYKLRKKDFEPNH